MLNAMVGSGVKVSADKYEIADDDAPAVLAEFVGDGDDVGALCLVDHRAALSLGGALVGVSPEAALEAIEGYKLDDEAIENVREVVNVIAQLFNSDFTPHLRFRELHRQPGKLPEGTQELRRKPRATRHYKVTVDKYATGYLSFLLG
ncbi:MAG: hypothetical protein JWL83_2760 [Actinomycetia bacterium]|jgi:hypothetical protein|nr:hypothetical protein [Actinomycetes bacterium]